MTILVAIETVLLVLALLLIVGLLRSHAEILRRLETGERDRRSADASTLPTMPPVQTVDRAAVVAELQGTTLLGEPLKVAMGAAGGTLVAFLSSGCRTCQVLWASLREGGKTALPDGVRLVIVTRDPSRESPSRLRELAPSDQTVVMSSRAWEDYSVPMTPYFVFVDGPSGRVAGEGTAERWDQVTSLLRDAVQDRAMQGPLGPLRPNGRGPLDQRPRHHELRLAGIGPFDIGDHGPQDRPR